MNKSDIKLVIIVAIIIILFFVIINFNKKQGSTANVYYEDKKILSIDLSIDKEYIVDGELGNVVIEVKDNKIRVKKENSLNHICSREGFISDSSKSLVCLPNKIIIKIEGEKELDGVVY